MQQDIDLRVAPAVAGQADTLLLAEAARAVGVEASRVRALKVVRRSIDARQRRVMVNVRVRLYLDEEPATTALAEAIDYQSVAADAPRAIVVGAGPAGLFAALRLVELGVRPIVLERGKDVDARLRDMAQIARNGVVDPDSNYCFGEGGAGAYSDGKLYTRSRKRGNVDKVLTILWQHGASEEILVDAHPHIGTDRLPKIIKAIRHTIEGCGGEVHFGCRVERLLIEEGRAAGVATAAGATYRGPVILATGHSARDVYASLHRSGVAIEAKGLAIGVRLEHPQQLIDQLQYHSPKGRGRWLPPAEYTMLTRIDGRAVYSFCMCPGGFIIPAASAPGQLAVNGMSPASRGTRWANSGMVVEILPEDVPDHEGEGPLKMMRLQERIEKAFYEEDGGSQNAPAQRMADFVEGRQSASLPASSYAPGVHPARVDHLLPAMIATRLQRGLAEFGRKQRGFLTNEAAVIGCETRTSSPVRVPRNEESLQHVAVPGLYPCGEGAGYAGGIVSAAIDGERCATALAESILTKKE